jgi:hypothetical protein
MPLLDPPGLACPGPEPPDDSSCKFNPFLPLSLTGAVTPEQRRSNSFSASVRMRDVAFPEILLLCPYCDPYCLIGAYTIERPVNSLYPSHKESLHECAPLPYAWPHLAFSCVLPNLKQAAG